MLTFGGLNCNCINIDGKHGIHYWKEYQGNGKYFPYICTNLDKAIKNTEDIEFLKAISLYSEQFVQSVKNIEMIKWILINRWCR